MSNAIAKEIIPKWNLDDLYTGPKAPELLRDLKGAETSAKSFSAQYKGKLEILDDAEFGRLITTYEGLSESLTRIMSYAQLLFSADAENPDVATFYQNISERVTVISSDTLFFELEINRIDEEILSKKLLNPKINKYQAWIASIRAYKPHQLTDEIEKVLHEKSVTGRASWSRLFDETMAGIRFDVDGRKISNSEIMTRMSDKDSLVRKKAAKSFGKGLEKNKAKNFN